MNNRSVLPSYEEVPVQMSPFGDDRWDMDIEENRRRKEIHRDYVYNLNYRKTVPSQPEPQEHALTEPQQPDPIVQPTIQPPEVAQEVDDVSEFLPKPQYEPVKKDFFKCEPPKVHQPKTLAEIPFETPNPPNLFPVLKFPEKRIGTDQIYKLSEGNVFVAPVAGVPLSVEVPELPPKPQFSTYKDIKFEKEKVFHYGVHVPFWQFTSKNNVPS